MKARTVSYVTGGAALLLLLAAGTTRAEALDCQALLRQILEGGAMGGAWGNAKAQEYNSNCLGQPPRGPQPTRTTPTYKPQMNAAGTAAASPFNQQPNVIQSDPNAWTNMTVNPTVQALAMKVIAALAALEAQLKKAQNAAELLSQGAPLSTQTVRQPQPVPQPPPVHNDRQASDPFATNPFLNVDYNILLAPNPLSGPTKAATPQDILDSQVAKLKQGVVSNLPGSDSGPPATSQPAPSNSQYPTDPRTPCGYAYCEPSNTFPGSFDAIEKNGQYIIRMPDGTYGSVVRN